jgi:hypothetical protein
VDIDVRVTGVVELKRKAATLTQGLGDLPVMQDIADQGARLARSFAPRHTGALISSIRGRKIDNKAAVIAGNAQVPYAAIQNARTRFLQRADVILTARAPGLLQRAVDQKVREAGLS